MSDAPTITDPAAESAVTAPLPPMPVGLPVRAGAACRACSAQLASDQRYCLECGARVGAARVEWPAVAAAPSPAARPAPGERPPRNSFATLLDRVGGPMGAAAVVLVALGIGFLLGQGGEGSGGPATVIQRPPVINVQSGGAAAGAATEGATLDDDAAAAGTRGRAGRGAAAGGTGSTAGIAPAAPDDAGGDLDRLQQQPTEQATQGAPPRRDDRPSGGGTEAETIG